MGGLWRKGERLQKTSMHPVMLQNSLLPFVRFPFEVVSSVKDRFVKDSSLFLCYVRTSGVFGVFLWILSMEHSPELLLA